VSPERSLPEIVRSLTHRDDAKVAEQLRAHASAVDRRLASIRRKVLVLSGKGGVGKSLVTVNLGLALARRGLRVGILDVDFNGPCVAAMLGMRGARFGAGAVPPAGPLGVRVASLAFLVGEGEAVRWEGPAHLASVWLGSHEMTVLRELLSDVAWGELDLLLCDCPPGAAADKPPALASLVRDLAGAVVVTTPSRVARDVVRRSIRYAASVGIGTLGLVENMTEALCGSCGAAVPLFEGDAVTLAAEAGAPVLGAVPLDPRLARAADDGRPLVDAADPIVRRFDAIASALLARLEGEKAANAAYAAADGTGAATAASTSPEPATAAAPGAAKGPMR
jgi:ATP-binding protein involved in chromosome partitioning